MGENPVDPPLRIYIEYEYLPVRHAGRILDGFAQTHRAVLMALLERFPAWSPYLKDPSPFELCVWTAHTGNSIEFAFAPKGRVWPKMAFDRERNLRIEIPRWAAPAVLVGAAVVGGGHLYGDFLDIELKQLEIQKIHRELEQPPDSEALYLSEQLRQINAGELVGSPNVSRWANNVRRRLHDPNIVKATINGIAVPVPEQRPAPRVMPNPADRETF